jgi:hypothetical protein
MRLGTEAREALGNRSGKGLGVEAEEALGNRHFGSFGRRSGMPGNRDSLGAGSEAQAASGNRRCRGLDGFQAVPGNWRRQEVGKRISANSRATGVRVKAAGNRSFQERRETGALERSGQPEISEEGGKARATGRERQLRDGGRKLANPKSFWNRWL